MPIGLGLLLGGGINGLGSLFGGLFSSNAAESAAQTQAAAAQRAAQLQFMEFMRENRNLAPFLNRGNLDSKLLFQLLGGKAGPLASPNALTEPLTKLLGLPPTPESIGGRIPTPQSINKAPIPVFNMPAFTAAQYHESPGYKFELGQGEQAIRDAASASGGAVSGNMLKQLQGYGTGLANQDYQQAYQNYASNYINKFNANNQNYWNNFNAGNQNYWNAYNAGANRYGTEAGLLGNWQSNLFNMLNTMAGAGQNAGANLGSLGQGAASNAGQDIIGGGNAIAAGQIGSANALVGGLTGLTNSFNPFLLAALSGQNGQNNGLSFLFGGGPSQGSFDPTAGMNQDYSSSF